MPSCSMISSRRQGCTWMPHRQRSAHCCTNATLCTHTQHALHLYIPVPLYTTNITLLLLWLPVVCTQSPGVEIPDDGVCTETKLVFCNAGPWTTSQADQMKLL
ncbi:hypothetical protein K439DRAFT_681928 [Ramaria rubella]|nr:hypothetical protein K439DRAFT_681928 [Ramaria rubella]